MTPGKYKARLKLDDRTHVSLFSIIHYITIHEDGSVTESHYTGDEDNFPPVFFKPERVWDPKLLDKHHVMPIV